MQNLLNRLFGPPSTPQSIAATPEQQALETLLETAATALEQGFVSTALETYQRGLEQARASGDRLYEERFLSGIGAAHVEQENFDAAHPILEEALALAEKLGDQRAMARCLNNLGSLHARRKQWSVAQNYHQRALDLARPTSDSEIIVLALENLAKDYLEQDNPNYAQHLLKEAVVLTQVGQQIHLAARIIGLLAEATLAVGDRPAGEKLLAQAARLAEQTGQPEQQLRWLQALARQEIENGNYTLAIEHYQAAENLALRMGSQPTEFFMESALALSTAYRMSGSSTQAEEYATRALAQARSTENAEHEISALTRLGMTAYMTGDYDRALGFLSEALAEYEAGALDRPDARFQILLTLGTTFMRQGRLAEARAKADAALQIARDQGNSTRQAEVLHLVGNLAAAEGDRDQALAAWQQALDLLESTDYVQIAQLHCDIARARKASGDFKAALTEYEKALLLLNHINHPPTRGLVLSNAATLYTDLGEVDTAQAFYEESITIARDTGDLRAESLRLGNLGWFFTLTGRPQSAIDRLEKALKISRALDDTLMIAVQTNNLARTYLQLKDFETARGLHKQAIAAATAIDADQWLAVFQSDMGETLAHQDRLDEAEALYLPALEKSRALDDVENIVRTEARLAAIYARTGRDVEAGELAARVETRARRMGYRKGQADALAVLGDIAQAQGDEHQAARHYAEAHRLYTILHDPAAHELQARIPTLAQPE